MFVLRLERNSGEGGVQNLLLYIAHPCYRLLALIGDGKIDRMGRLYK